MSGQWRAQPERGSRNALRLIIWLALRCGRPLCRVLLVPISAYFFVTAPLARGVSPRKLTDDRNLAHQDRVCAL